MIDIRDHGGTYGGSSKYGKGKNIRDEDLIANPIGTIVKQSTSVSYANRIFRGNDGHLYVLGSLIYRVDDNLNVIASSNAWTGGPVNGFSVDPFNNVWVIGNYGTYTKINLETLTLVFTKTFNNARDITHDHIGNAYIIATNHIMSVDFEGIQRWLVPSVSQDGGKVFMGSNGDVYFMYGGNMNNDTLPVLIRYTTGGNEVSRLLPKVTRYLLHAEEVDGYIYAVNLSGSYNYLMKINMADNSIIYNIRLRFINDTLLTDTQRAGMAIVKSRFLEVYGKGGINNLHKMTVDELKSTVKLEFYPTLSSPTNIQPKGFLLDQDYIYICLDMSSPNSVLKQLRYNLHTIL